MNILPSPLLLLGVGGAGAAKPEQTQYRFQHDSLYSIIFPGDVLKAIGSDEQFSAFRKAVEHEVVGEDP